MKKSPVKTITKVDFSALSHPKEIAVASLLGQFPEIVSQAAVSLKPVLVSRYLVDLARSFSEFYEACPILTETKNIANARLLVADCTRQVIKNGLALLGIEAPEVM